MIENVQNIINGIQGNQLLIALMGGGIFWSLLSHIQSIFGTIWNCILACISFTVNSVNVGDYDQPILSYKIIKVLSDSKIVWERHTEIQPSSSDYNEEHLMNSAYGRSYRIMWGHFMILDREYSTQSTKVVVKITARIFFANRKKFIDRLMKEIERCSLTENRDTIVVNMGKGIITEKPKRNIDTIYSNDNAEKKVLNDIKAFIANRDVYLKNSSPYKFVCLLSGLPGTGKTSIIHAIASELGLGIRFVNVDDENFEDIARIMTNRSDSTSEFKKDIIVIEDVDAMSVNADDRREIPNTKDELKIEDGDSPDVIEMKRRYNRDSIQDYKPNSLSLSSILNLLDGIITPNGTIVFLTSNNPDKLDKALLRDGRIDSRYDFTNFNKETSNRMINDYLGFRIDNIKDNIVPSSLQRDVLKVKIGRMDRNELIEKYSL